ncbi:ParA family protein [uncultured Deinococcus sp.]|uniref:ParA family protein n=1 Tax=uncultured Deinococcus sp. TaxID=158789 RepID=UPI0025899970|nr:ParA family protein [uncultured Deinococcus sp.]
MKVISIYNQAGGAGKTTVTRDLGYALTQLGFRVLLVDLDSQASLTRWLGQLAPGTDGSKPAGLRLDRTVFPVLTDPDADLPEPLNAFGMDLIPANTKLSVGDSVLYDDQNRMGQLRAAIRRVQGYDFVLIDAPPGRTAMALAGVAASDHLLIPVNVAKALDNIDNVAEVLTTARRFSPSLSVLALVPHSFMRNTRHHKDVLRGMQEDLAALAPTTTPISHKDTLYDDATLYQQPIAVYAPRNSAPEEYRRLAGEVLALLGMQPTAGATS